MPDTPRRPIADALRTATFRDRAREIVWMDRAERKAGRSVDTAGTIARALEQAYGLGFEDAQVGQPVRAVALPDAPMTWDLIPRRPRRAFWGICHKLMGEGSQQQLAGSLSRALLERGGPGWRLDVTGMSGEAGRLYADRDVAVLVRHDLLGLDPERPEHLVLTKRARSTWWTAIDVAGSPIALPF